MTRITNLIWQLRIWRDTRGQDMIEYALIAGLIAVAAVASMNSIGGAIGDLFGRVEGELTSIP